MNKNWFKQKFICFTTTSNIKTYLKICSIYRIELLSNKEGKPYLMLMGETSDGNKQYELNLKSSIDFNNQFDLGFTELKAYLIS